MKYILLVSTALLILSCKKDKENNQTLSCNPIATMGDTTLNCYSTNADSAIINVNNFNTAVEYDLDMDGVADIQLRVEKMDNTPTAQVQQYERVVNINPTVFDVAIVKPDTIETATVLNNIPNWSAQSNVATLMYYEQPYTNPNDTIIFDPAPTFNSIPFIIFRKNTNGVYKYGWAYLTYLRPCINTYCYYNRIAIGPAYLQQ